MAQITELSVLSLPGRVHSFSAKAEAAVEQLSALSGTPNTVPELSGITGSVPELSGTTAVVPELSGTTGNL